MIGRITPSGAITEFPLAQGTTPIGITAGPGGDLWFFTGGSTVSKIGRITPSGQVSEFRLPASGSFPSAITEGPDRDLWITEGAVNSIGRMTPTGKFSESKLTSKEGLPGGITSGPRGELWFTEEKAEAIGWVKPAPPEKCVVPKLKGKTLSQAKRLLSRAHCRLGKVTKQAQHGRKLVVIAQKPAAKKSLTIGSKVSLRLG
jgi:streptogramin lyase